MNIQLEIPKEEPQTEQERHDHCAAIFAVFPRIKKDIKEKMYEQLTNLYSVGIGTSKTKEERDFEIIRGNGILEGMAILLTDWQAAATEFEASAKESQEDEE